MTHIKAYPCVCPAPKLIIFYLQFFSFKKEVPGGFPRKGGSCMRKKCTEINLQREEAWLKIMTSVAAGS